MTDDFSLKGKKVSASFDYDEGTVLHDEEYNDIEVYKNDVLDFFPVKVIETLHVKLIEAFEDKVKPFRIEEYQPFLSLSDVRTIINRLFGVKK